MKKWDPLSIFKYLTGSPTMHLVILFRYLRLMVRLIVTENMAWRLILRLIFFDDQHDEYYGWREGRIARPDQLKMKQMSSAVSAWLHLHAQLSILNYISQKMLSKLRSGSVGPETLNVKVLWINNLNRLKLINGDD